MLHVFICEDNPFHKEQIQKCVENCITIYNLDMEIALSTANPQDIVDYLENKQVSGLYFLDVELETKINGVELAATIREYDTRGFIVFITTNDNALPQTFRYKVEAMDYILKEQFCDIQSRIYDCILNAHKKYSAKATELQKNFSFNDFDRLVTIAYSKIFYFETTPGRAHKIMIHTTDGIFEFSGKLNKLTKILDESFYRCHNSYIINMKQEIQLDVKERMVYFEQGRSCCVSSRNLRPLMKLLDNVEKYKVVKKG